MTSDPSNPSLATQMILARILKAGAPDAEKLGHALGARLRRTETADPNETYEAELPETSPFSRAHLQVNVTRGTGTLSLTPRDGAEMTEASVTNSGLSKAPPVLDVNLHVPPEGVHTLIYKRDRENVAMQFFARSKKLRALSVEWTRRSV